jgi:hypothetical protein
MTRDILEYVSGRGNRLTAGKNLQSTKRRMFP